METEIQGVLRGAKPCGLSWHARKWAFLGCANLVPNWRLPCRQASATTIQVVSGLHPPRVPLLEPKRRSPLGAKLLRNLGRPLAGFSGLLARRQPPNFSSFPHFSFLPTSRRARPPPSPVEPARADRRRLPCRKDLFKSRRLPTLPADLAKNPFDRLPCQGRGAVILAAAIQVPPWQPGTPPGGHVMRLPCRGWRRPAARCGGVP